MTTFLGLTPNFLGEIEYSTSTQGNPPGPLFWIGYSVVLILLIASIWKVFSKAGQPGWAVLIPFFNVYVLCKVAGRPGWWLILMLIPFVNFVIAIILSLDLAKAFGKGAGFAVGLILLPFIFYPILGFGSAQYRGPSPTIKA
jgi:ABC-type sulfate transport system permease subunit